MTPMPINTGNTAFMLICCSLVMLMTMVLCFALTISVAVSIGLASIVGIQVNNANMLISVKEMFNAINKFPLAAIPFFILAGKVVTVFNAFKGHKYKYPEMSVEEAMKTTNNAKREVHGAV